MNQVERNTQRFLAELDYEADTPPDQPSATGPTTKATGMSEARQAGKPFVGGVLLKLLTLLAVPVPPPLLSLYEQLHFSRREGRRLVLDAEHYGLVRCVEVSTGKRGGAMRLPQLLDPGKEQLRQHGITCPPSRTRGGWLHNVGAEAAAELFRREGWQVEFEIPFGDRCMDLRARRSDGKVLVCQIGVSSPTREAQSMHSLLSTLGEQHRVMLVCLDRKFQREFERKVRKDEASRIELRLLGQVLEKYHHSGGGR